MEFQAENGFLVLVSLSFIHAVDTAVDRGPDCVMLFDRRGTLKRHMRVRRGNGFYYFVLLFALVQQWTDVRIG
jgi:hypothetical protein